MAATTNAQPFDDTIPTVLLLGATSDIGGELVARLCQGKRVVLAARRVDALAPLEGTLMAQGAISVVKHHFDATTDIVATAEDAVNPATGLRGIVEGIANLECAIVAFGILGDQTLAEHSEAHAYEIAHVDYALQVAALTVLADAALKQPQPATLVAFSSIAGWRARKANYVYGSTKAGLDAFCQGLADRLHGTNVRLITARPGFVIGSMTQGMKPAPLSSTPAQVADAIAAAIAGSDKPGLPSSRKASVTLWIPRRLQVLAWVMKLVPRPVWRMMPR
ncbi:SDR family NAD(P)-dependent oxidoreductase [Corynebacterium sp. SCR221107]|uniref:SDR family NAD(P)-dependent oxidoreductase n=1 Tax=Corynebacterium sp. SCR221107 TaxID=3017361 RepID=UPI0022EC280A|nr:SDR family NAD(P)-dependent oxidoreductase [Corynebacterium sp. SCR221107]WBT07684.1 SDR family NAD(P)-dependent oxidoreductase [Corynebacterium sp. SCR221107]